jgi:dihydroneopterin aldolase
MLTIALHRIEFEGRHGATAVERRSTRKFQVDVEMDVEAAAERTDRLVDTVDYSRVAETIVDIGAGEPHRMLESLARKMADGVQARFPEVRLLRLALRKLNPPSCAGHPAYAEVRVVAAKEPSHERPR